MNMLAMELQRDKQKINLTLVDDNNKMYSLARWKVAQELYQGDTLTIPGITEKEISHFDKELDLIEEKIQSDKDELKKEIKKKIILHHLPAYKAVFDYLLVSMIADNFYNDRVKAEKAYSFEPELVKKTDKGNLYIPPVNKLKEEDFNDAVTGIPLTTMMCIRDNNRGCVDIFNHNRSASDRSGNVTYSAIGTVSYDQKDINGLGVTTDLRYLVATFDNMLVSKAELYSEDDRTTYDLLRGNIKLADIYLLLHLYKGMQQRRRADLQDNEDDYIRNYLTINEKGREFIQKYFLS
jgi:hypothetical protein